MRNNAYRVQVSVNTRTDTWAPTMTRLQRTNGRTEHNGNTNAQGQRDQTRASSLIPLPLCARVTVVRSCCRCALLLPLCAVLALRRAERQQEETTTTTTATTATMSG